VRITQNRVLRPDLFSSKQLGENDCKLEYIFYLQSNIRTDTCKDDNFWLVITYKYLIISMESKLRTFMLQLSDKETNKLCSKKTIVTFPQE
jgi:hypothetical protein